jgi:UDP-3-O-[3-hydroxymyristoyl] N-acetylglucosamine deacetylase
MRRDNFQGTVAVPVTFEGSGLHTGRSCKVTILPAPVNHGLVFNQIDRRDRVTTIRADWRNIRDLPLCTCLTDGRGSQIRTVEHLLAACYACGLDNALIEVRGREIPIMDGSAQPIVDAIRTAGISVSNTTRARLCPSESILVQDGARWMRLEPAEVLHITLETYVRGFGPMKWQGHMDRQIFSEQIASARTYGALRDGIAAKLLTFFLPDPICLGASTKSVAVIANGQVINADGLRFPDEFPRHRVLDLMGDLMLGGMDVVGRITCYSPVHRLNRMFLEAVFRDRRD